MALGLTIPFQKLSLGGPARPVADVGVDGLREAPVRCLLDTGSVHTLFSSWVAREAGLELKGAPERRLALGGRSLAARFATVRLYIDRHSWEAEVGFCDEWPWDHQVLGLGGFFRWFDVTISVAAQRTMLVPTD